MEATTRIIDVPDIPTEFRCNVANEIVLGAEYHFGHRDKKPYEYVIDELTHNIANVLRDKKMYTLTSRVGYTRMEVVLMVGEDAKDAAIMRQLKQEIRYLIKSRNVVARHTTAGQTREAIAVRDVLTNIIREMDSNIHSLEATIKT